MASARLETGRNGPSGLWKTANETAPAGRAALRDFAIIAGLVALSVGTLWPVVTFGLVDLDDYVWLEVSRAREGLSLANVGRAFVQLPGYYMPITTISRMLDVQLFGMNFAGHHAANLFYHACAVIVLFWLLRRSTGRPWCSAFAASLFAVHPLNAGTVAWFSCRHDILSALLGLLALLAYARYAAGPSVRRYVPVMVLFAMSLMSKPVFTTFPAVMLFLDFWPLKRMEDLEFGDQAGRMRFCRLVAEKIPLFVIGLSIAVLGYFGQRSYGTISSSDAYPFLKRAANAATSYVTYLWNGLWPTGLAACYPYPAMLWWKTAGALALLAACTAFAIVYRKRFPYIFVGWFWYGLALLPSSGILAQLGDQSRADRYTYVSMIGLFVAASWGLGAVVRRWRRTAVALPVAVVTAVAAYAAVAHVQVHYWSDSATLFQHAIDVTSDNYMAYAFLGKALAGQGRDEEAIAAFKEALRIAPHSIEVHNNLGNVLYRKGSYGEAVGHFAEALRRNPGDATDLHNMDLALSRPLVAAFQRQTVLHNMGLALLAQDKCDEAIACFRQAIAANPDFALAHNNLGYALARKGAFEEAVVEYREALRTEPKFGLALYNMGDALLAQGKCEDAIQTYTHAAEADPQKRHEALNNIGNVLVRQGKNDEAVAYFRQAIAANPDFALAHNNLGYELARKGGLAEAVAEYREALRSDPNFTLALNNLGHALADMGQPNEAANLFRKAIEIDPKDKSAFYNLATVVAGQGELEDAISLYQKALDNAPGNASIANDLGVALVHLGRVDTGITWFRKAIEIDPRSVPARLNWGRVLASQKRYAEACDQFAEALKISPQNVAAREALEAARGALQGTGPSVHNPAVTIEDLR